MLIEKISVELAVLGARLRVQSEIISALPPARQYAEHSLHRACPTAVDQRVLVVGHQSLLLKITERGRFICLCDQPYVIVVYRAVTQLSAQLRGSSLAKLYVLVLRETDIRPDLGAFVVRQPQSPEYRPRRESKTTLQQIAVRLLAEVSQCRITQRYPRTAQIPKLDIKTVSLGDQLGGVVHYPSVAGEEVQTLYIPRGGAAERPADEIAQHGRENLVCHRFGDMLFYNSAHFHSLTKTVQCFMHCTVVSKYLLLKALAFVRD